MGDSSWSHVWHNSHLNLNFFQAFHEDHNYPRHSHDYFVIAVVDKGLQSFSFGRGKQITPVNGLILLNPGEVHTGEPVNESGFGYSAFYPTFQHVETTVRELPGYRGLPSFAVPRADDMRMAQAVRAFHTTLKDGADPLESESKFLWTLVELIRRYGDKTSNEVKGGSEHLVVKKVQAYIHENYAQPLSLSELADYVHFSRYYLLHIFREELGMPPHTYLENIRVRRSLKLLAEGEPLIEVAQRVGFGSQSHFTRRFKQIMGVTPGEYARQLKK
jgi:AraC-like DNA-binding protein